MSGRDRILSWLHKAKDQGLIRHICASFHGPVDDLKKLAETDEFSSFTVQYNLLDRALEPVFPELSKRDIGIVVMGPIGGGRLAVPSEAFATMVPGAGSVAETALRFVLANPHVTSAISGMSTVEQVEENCAIGERDEALSEAEGARVADTLAQLEGLADLYCTGCNYCMPCASGVDIPATFAAVNAARVYGLDEHAQWRHDHLVGKPAYCVACGVCEPKCPQNIPIRAQIREAIERFDPAWGQMAVSFTPLSRVDGAIECVAAFHNLSDQGNQARVRFEGEPGIDIEPAEFDVDIAEPFKQREEEVTLTPGPQLDLLSLSATVKDAAGTRTEALRYRLGECHAVASMDDLNDRRDMLTPIRINRQEQVLAGAGFVDNPTLMTGWMGYTPDAFLMLAHMTPACVDAIDWSLLLLTDLRQRTGPTAPDVNHDTFIMRVAPAADGASQTTAPQGRLDAGAVDVQRAPCGDLEELRITIPWAAFRDSDPDTDPGQAIGFDVVMMWIGEGTVPIMRATWSGNSPAPHEARLGTLFFA
ncbi:MAG: hypothetical protein GY851_16040 [bacterium]|nr:hypothetical protein [bacterium]